jgi:hypothetical protein
MTVREGLAVGTLGLLFLGTLLRLAPALAPAVTRLDLFMLLPEWRFFAPKPGRGDHFLLYRDSPNGVTWGAWTEIPLNAPRRWHHFIWNPHRRAKKALLDFIAALAARVAATGPAGIEITLPYLALLKFVMTSPPRTGRPSLTQFLILNHDGAAAPDDFVPLFVSKPHAYGDD